MVTAGWTVINDQAGSTITMEGSSLDNSYPCYVQFTVKTNTSKTNGRYLVLRGWLTASGTTNTIGSPDDTLRMEFIETAINRLWLTVDEEAGCLCVFSNDEASAGVHFGFLERVDKDDAFAWMVGYIISTGYTYAYVAKAKHNNVNWRCLVDDYYYGTNYSEYRQVLPFSCFDLTMYGKPYDHFTNSNGVNAFRYAYLGRRNYDGKALISPYYYLEGRGSTSAYGYRSEPYFRGMVKYAYCGVSSESPCLWSEDPATGHRIMSVGAAQWQGMRTL